MTSADFMVMPPMISRYKEDGSARGEVTELVTEAIRAGFGEEVPDNLLQVAEHALASVLYHWDFLRATLPARHRLFANVFLLDEAQRTRLRNLVICCMGNSTEARRERRTPTGAHTVCICFYVCHQAHAPRAKGACATGKANDAKNVICG